MSVDGIGIGRIKNLLAKFQSTEKVFSASVHELMDVEGLSIHLAQRIHRCNDHRSEIENIVNDELERLFKINGSLISLWDDEYPSLLRKIYDPPILLYARGKFTDPDDYSIAVVGTRQPTNYGKIQAEKIVSDLADQKITIVSGMARGIDSMAHRTALKNKSRTIAVLGSGLNVIYPPENKKLYDEISESGVVITEYSLDTKPDAVNFPKRNRIISGLSPGGKQDHWWCNANRSLGFGSRQRSICNTRKSWYPAIGRNQFINSKRGSGIGKICRRHSNRIRIKAKARYW
jgi:DNA processing protein